MSNLSSFFTSGTAPAAVNFGTCWGTPLGQTLSTPSYMATGQQAVAEAILRRWSARPGQFIIDPNAGYCLLDLLGQSMTPSDVANAQQQSAAEALKDQRVKSSVVTIALLANGALRVSGAFATALGPFSLVVSVSQASGIVVTQGPRQ